jgi:raffinose/stachyose/melibiose transport system permease protein
MFSFFLILIFMLAPLYLLFVNSVKSALEFQANPFSLPSHLLLSNFIPAWSEGGYAQAFLNSFFVGIAAVIVVDFFAGSCAYSLAKLHPKGKNGILTYFLITMTISVSLCLVPLFYLWQTLHLMNTLTGLIIIYSGVNLAFSITFLRSFFISIPDAILESARIDGCSEFELHP